MRKEGAPLGVFRHPSYVQDIMGYVNNSLIATGVQSIACLQVTVHLLFVSGCDYYWNG